MKTPSDGSTQAERRAFIGATLFQAVRVRPDAPRPRFEIACGRCGHSQDHDASVAHDLCQQCGAVVEVGLEAVHQAAKLRAALRARSERRQRERSRRYEAGGWDRDEDDTSDRGVIAILAVGGALMIYLGTGAVGKSYEPLAVSAYERLWPFAIGFACFIVAGIWIAYRRKRRAQWTAARRHLLRLLGGRLHTDYREWLEWLNAYWPAEASVDHGELGFAISFGLGGRSALLLVEPDPHRGGPRIDLFVSIPNTSALSLPAYDGGWQGLLNEATWRACGLHVCSDSDGVKRVHRRPHTLAHLEPVLTSLARVVSGLQPLTPTEGGRTTHRRPKPEGSIAARIDAFLDSGAGVRIQEALAEAAHAWD